MTGRILKKLRLDANLTQKQLADKLNVSPSTIAMYESNKREPDICTLKAMSDIFAVSVDFLLDSNKANYEINLQTLGGRISDSRKSANLTQDQVAKKLNVARTAVSHWEGDSREPDLRTIKTLAKIFNVSFEYLVGVRENEIQNQFNQLIKTPDAIVKEFGDDITIIFKDTQNWDDKKIDKLHTLYQLIRDEKI